MVCLQKVAKGCVVSETNLYELSILDVELHACHQNYVPNITNYSTILKISLRWNLIQQVRYSITFIASIQLFLFNVLHNKIQIVKTRE